uniref:Uncharacterized protein n=1 Tax=Papilio xuthus TaxID=66420 RepID=I4DQJ6_PAPXU|nr:unknown unsecreted protein [Papilio xuthus]
MSVGGSVDKHLTWYLQVLGSNPAMYRCVFRFPIYICTFIQRSYDERKHRDTCTYLRINSKICVKSTNPALGQRG